MGGSNETMINGLRLHIKDREVHVHDDKKQLKFSTSLDDFKNDVEGALEEVEGLIRIIGNTPTDLCMVKEKGKLNIFLTDKNNVTSELQSFLNKI